MTFTVYQNSRQSNTLVNCYLFRYGAGPNSRLAYTDHTKEITFDVNPGGTPDLVTFTPLAINRGKIAVKGNLDKSRMPITIPINDPLAQLFRSGPPTFAVTCVIWHGHTADPDEEYLVAWTGRILSAKHKRPRTELTGELVVTSMRRSGLRRHFQYGCPLPLYDTDTCRADKVAATVTGSVGSITGNNITFDAGWEGAFQQTDFNNGGTAEWTTPDGDIEYRSIRSVSGNVVTLNIPPKGLSVSDSVDLAIGCNHAPTNCEFLHVEVGTGNPNIVNYGGQPEIPTKNPTGFRSNYY